MRFYPSFQRRTFVTEDTKNRFRKEPGSDRANAPATQFFHPLRNNPGLTAAAGALALGFGYLLYHNSKKDEDKDELPGRSMSVKTKVLETGSGVMQSFTPVKAIHMHLCGFHFYSGDRTRQVEAHHYCNHLNEDVAQCVIYDSDRPDARLIGVEYIVSERVFKDLPDEEKRYWHSHVHEVKGGVLTAPRLPEAAEHKLMSELVNTYGKTFHMWQVDRGDRLPLGPPQLMMSTTRDGMIKEELLKSRDAKQKVDISKLKEQRKDIPTPQVDPKADIWKTGKAPVFETKMVDQK